MDIDYLGSKIYVSSENASDGKKLNAALFDEECRAAIKIIPIEQDIKDDKLKL